MTKREALRQTQQENTLLELGFTRAEAEALRRISVTLQHWQALECGTASYAVVRGQWNQDAQTFEYDKGPNGGRPYYEWANESGCRRYTLIADRETGAKKRLAKILAARNDRHQVRQTAMNVSADAFDQLSTYIQTDPRGAALYILRPGDVPEGKSVESYYNRGVCVY